MVETFCVRAEDETLTLADTELELVVVLCEDVVLVERSCPLGANAKYAPTPATITITAKTSAITILLIPIVLFSERLKRLGCPIAFSRK